MPSPVGPSGVRETPVIDAPRERVWQALVDETNAWWLPDFHMVGEGSVVTLGSQIAFRTQTRGTFKLLFNAIFQGPAETVNAAELSRLD